MFGKMFQAMAFWRHPSQDDAIDAKNEALASELHTQLRELRKSGHELRNTLSQAVVNDLRRK